MMKRCCAVIIALLTATLVAYSQVTVQVVTRTPMPASLAEWQRDRSLFQIILFNPPGAAAYRDARISFLVREAGGTRIVAQSQDYSPAIPRFTIPAGPATVVRTGADVINEQSTTVDASLRSTVVTTNSIPEGNYEFCVRVFDAQNNEIGASGELCRLFSVIIPDPPSLIQPANGEMLPAGVLPVFSWTPVLIAGQQVRFKLRVVPLFEGQNSRIAMDNNQTLFEQTGIAATSFQYSPAHPRFALFPTAVGFAWQIQALDAAGRPAARNNGKSEIFSFKFGKTIPEGGGGTIGSDTTGGGGLGGGLGGSGGTLSGGASGGGASSGGSRVSIIGVGEFTLKLDSPRECKGECTLDGSGKIYVPLLGDSVAVRFSGLGVRRSVRGMVAFSGEIRAQLPVSKRWNFAATTLEINSLRWMSESASFDGRMTIDWAELGLGGGFGIAVLNGAALLPAEIPAQTVRTSLNRSGRDANFGECLTLAFDSLNVAVSPARAFSGSLAGEVLLPCLQTLDGATGGRFTLPLATPDDANLLLAIKSPLRDIRLPGSPLSFSTETLLLDLSGGANFPAVTTSNLCLYAESWSNPLWRGVIIPEGRFAIAADDKSVVVLARNAVLEPDGAGFALSVRAFSTEKQQATLGGFRLAIDTVLLEVCRQTVQKAAISGNIFLPESFKLPTAATGFDKVRARLTADGSWNWRGIVELERPARLPFGNFGAAEFSRGAATFPANGAAVLEWTAAELTTGKSGRGISLAGAKFTTGGTVIFGSDGWRRLAPAVLADVAGLPLVANEIGFGYADEQWRFGLSGAVALPEESGLSALGGIAVKRLQVSGRETFRAFGEESAARLFAGNHLEISGNLRLDAITGAGYGLTGRLNATFRSVGGAMLPVDFALGRANDGRLFWYAVGAAVYDEPPVFAQSFSLFGGAFGAGWNVVLGGCDSSAVEQTLISKPVVKFAESPLMVRAGLLLGEPTRRAFRLAATTLIPSGGQSGTLANHLEISGNAVVQPAQGFARGYLAGQISAPGAPLRLTGYADLNLAGTVFSGVGFAVESGIGALGIRFNGISGRLPLFEKYSTGDKTAQAGALQCAIRNAEISVTSREAKVTGDITPLVAVGGISPAGGIGYVVAEGEQAPCIRLMFAQDDKTAVSDIAAAFAREGTSLVALDVLPCAGALSVAASGELSSRHRRADGTWEMQSAIPAEDCGALAVPAQAAVTAAVKIVRYAEVREALLRTGDEQTAITFPAWSARSEAGQSRVKIAATFAGKSWELSQDAPQFLSCEELAAEAATLLCDAQAVAAAEKFSLKNAGNTVIPQGSRFAVTLRYNAGGGVQTAIFTLELTSDLTPGAEYPIEIRRFIGRHGAISSAALLVQALAPLSDGNAANDCSSFGSATCP